MTITIISIDSGQSGGDAQEPILFFITSYINGVSPYPTTHATTPHLITTTSAAASPTPPFPRPALLLAASLTLFWLPLGTPPTFLSSFRITPA